jgi:hypothetical protein
MKTPILGSSYVIRSPNAADSRMVNLYPEVILEGGLEAAYLQRCPGLRFIATVGSGPIVGAWSHGTLGYVVSGTEFYSVTSTGVPTLIGTVENTGFVSMADNGTQLFIAAGAKGYIYNFDTNVLAEITDEDFHGATTVGYLDGYFVFSEPNSQRLWVTSLFDGTSVDPTDFASAEGAPDDIVGLVVNHREVWVFGTNSTEVWYNSGDADFPLARIQGAYNEVGCVAPNSISKLDNSIVWLGQDARGQGIVYRAEGYRAQRISTHAVEFAVQGYVNIADAVSYSYQQDGHEFYIINFPLADTTWCLDASTNAWHERRGLLNGQFTRHRGNCFVNFNGALVVGDYENGNLYAFDLDVYADNGETQKWLRRWRALPTGANDFKRTAQHALQLICETGVGLDGYVVDEALLVELGVVLLVEAGIPLMIGNPVMEGADPQVMLRWSDDGGHTWSNEHWKSLGRIGQSQTRVIWRRLGMTEKLRDRVYEVSGTAPVKVAIMGAELSLSGTDG